MREPRGAGQLKSHGIVFPVQGRAKQRIKQTYDYRGEKGDLLFQVVRLEPKSFRQRQPDPSGGWIWSLKGCKRVLYRLPELMAADAGRIVYFVEGEKDADRLSKCGLIATTNPGGSNKWRDEYAPMLAGRRVAVLSDNDTPGNTHASAVVNALVATAKSVARVMFTDLPPKGDVSDWLDAGGSAKDLEALAEAAFSEAAKGVTQGQAGQLEVGHEVATRSISPANASPEPVPLLRPEETAEPVPVEHLGPLLEPVKAIEILTQAPMAICLQSVLGVVSIAVQGLANVEAMVGPVPTSLSLLTVAQSGERKSACDKLALASIRDVEQARISDFQSAMRAHQMALVVYEAERRTILKIQNTVERDADLEALGLPPTAPLAPHILFGDPTLEGLLRHFAEGQPSIGVFSDEGGQLIGGHAMNADNKLKTAAAYSKLWDGGEINRARASAPATRYYNRRMACHLMVQPMVAAKLLADPTIRDQGLLSRVLLAWPESRIGYRKRAPEDVQASAELSMEAFHKRITELVETPLPTDVDPKELTPRLLQLSPGARILLMRFAEAVEVSQRPGGPCAGIRGAASKAAEQAARIAGVMALFECPDTKEVSDAIMASAIGLMDWYLREARRLLDTGPVSQKSAEAEVLRLWLTEQYKGDIIDIRTVVRCGPRCLRDTSAIKSLFKELEKNNHLLPIHKTGRKEEWRIVRS